MEQSHICFQPTISASSEVELTKLPRSVKSCQIQFQLCARKKKWKIQENILHDMKIPVKIFPNVKQLHVRV